MSPDGNMTSVEYVTSVDNVSWSSAHQDASWSVKYRVDMACLALQLLLMLPICVGNVLVLRAIHQFPRLQTSTNAFLYSLAVSDLLVGLVTTPAFALIHNAHLPALERHQFSCVLSYTLAHCPVGVSMTTLFAIAVERYVAIHYPFHYKRYFGRRVAVGSSCLIWLYVWLVIPTVSWSTHRWHAAMDDCNFGSVLSKSYIALLLTHMLVILVVTTLLYLKIACTAHAHHVAIRQQQTLNNSSSCQQNNTTFNHNTKLAKMLATILGIFYVSWIPYFLSMPFALSVDGPDPVWLHVWEQFAGIVVRCNAFMNPLVYALSNRDFARAFRKVIRCRWQESTLSEEIIILPGTTVTNLKSTNASSLNSVNRI